MTEINLVFPNQLFANSEQLKNGFPVYLVEESLFFTQFAFHKQKLAYHRTSMKFYEDYLIQRGFEVKYIDAVQETSDTRKLIPFLNTKGIEKIHFTEPSDNWLEKRLLQRAKTEGIELKAYASPQWLNTRQDLKTFFRSDKKKFFQTSFYQAERKRLNLLLDDKNQPLGGKWSFDDENRLRYPKGKTPPLIRQEEPSEYFKEACIYVERYFPNNPGKLGENPIYPFDFESSEEWFRRFLEERFHDFGTYEDAIVFKEKFLNHSVLTPMLNSGLLTPAYVLQEVIDYANKSQIPINSTEGFVRQIIGWREFIRGVYLAKGVEERTKNYWGFTRKIPPSFYTGETGILPIDETIKKLLETGYCHHIERLMVLGNFMLLCEFDPDEVYRWFMELFIDAYDWVMVPNIYGMSQFADGGLTSTKPYISSSNYLIKMSDYPKGDWQKTWDGLYWQFIANHRDFFEKNPRLGMMVRVWDKMDETKKDEHLNFARLFLGNLI